MYSQAPATLVHFLKKFTKSIRYVLQIGILYLLTYIIKSFINLPYGQAVPDRANYLGTNGTLLIQRNKL